MIATLLLATLLQSGDTVRVPRIDSIAGVGDSVTVGRPTVVIRTANLASVWLARRRDTIELYAAIPDTTVDWSDDFVISLSLGGAAGNAGARGVPVVLPAGPGQQRGLPRTRRPLGGAARRP